MLTLIKSKLDPNLKMMIAPWYNPRSGRYGWSAYRYNQDAYIRIRTAEYDENFARIKEIKRQMGVECSGPIKGFETLDAAIDHACNLLHCARER